jgi:ATP-dependent Clp protease adaptor protein ClpS
MLRICDGGHPIFLSPGAYLQLNGVYIITACAEHCIEYGIFGTIKGHMSERRHNPGLADDSGLAVEEAKPRLKEPSRYRVVLLNDDYTPMYFVVDILVGIFSMERIQATQVMLEIHTRGKGVCGTYNFEIAETKVAQVMGIAKQHQHPLLCTMEEA